MTNHIAKDCRASQEKQAKYRLQQKKNVQEITESTGAASSSRGQDALGSLCGLGLESFHRRKKKRWNQRQHQQPEDLAQVRADPSGREIIFGIDSGACVTVVPKTHPAARGYITHADDRTGGKLQDS